jgi:MarR family transcriptional repressor of emrRAB
MRCERISAFGRGGLDRQSIAGVGRTSTALGREAGESAARPAEWRVCRPDADKRATRPPSGVLIRLRPTNAPLGPPTPAEPASLNAAVRRRPPQAPRWYVCITHMSTRNANLVGALGLALADRLTDAAAPAGGGSAAEALVTLHERHPGSAIDGVARVLGLSHSGTVRLVDRLAAAGLVERRRGADHRTTALYLTPAGRRTARRVLTRREANVQSLLSLLTGDQQAQLAQLAEAILRQLADQHDAERRICRLCDLEACGRSRGLCPMTTSKA